MAESRSTHRDGILDPLLATAGADLMRTFTFLGFITSCRVGEHVHRGDDRLQHLETKDLGRSLLL